MKYRVTGTVVIYKEIVEYFEDDGQIELYDQAYQAIRDSDDIPIGCNRYIEGIEDIKWEEVKP